MDFNMNMNFQRFAEVSNIPRLIEQNTGYYLHQTLQTCHANRQRMYSWIFNIIIVTIFIVVTAIILYFCRTNKKSPEEKERQAILDQQLILDKIRALEYQKNKFMSRESITQMPMPNSVGSDIPLTYSTRVPV